jgi:polyisoprenoid-binding protein YceI
MTSTIIAPPELITGTYVIDPVHSEVGFSVRHLMSKVRGKFIDFEGTIEVGDNPLDSKTAVTVQIGSVTTGNPQRDADLGTSQYFEVDKYPTMTFVSKGFRQTGDSAFVLVGDLTIKDVTKEVELEVDYLGVDQDPWGNTRVGFEAATSVNRREFNVTGNVPLNGEKVLIGDQIAVTLLVQAVKQ